MIVKMVYHCTNFLYSMDSKELVSVKQTCYQDTRGVTRTLKLRRQSREGGLGAFPPRKFLKIRLILVIFGAINTLFVLRKS